MLEDDLRSIKVVACWKRSVRRVVKFERLIKVHGTKRPRARQVKVGTESLRFRSLTFALQCVSASACEGGRNDALNIPRIDPSHDIMIGSRENSHALPSSNKRTNWRTRRKTALLCLTLKSTMALERNSNRD